MSTLRGASIITSSPILADRDQEAQFPDNASDTYEDAPSTATVKSTSDGQILLAEDPFSNQASRQLFDAIDELRACSDRSLDLDLPQVSCPKFKRQEKLIPRSLSLLEKRLRVNHLCSRA